MIKLIFQCSVQICNRTVGVKFYKDDTTPSNVIYEFVLSEYLKEKGAAGIYYPSPYAQSLEDCISKLNYYIKYFNNIEEIELNTAF